VHSAGRRRVRRPHGGCPRPICRKARSEASGGLFRREPNPAHRRGPPAEPGQLERYDCEYRRNGTANLFIFLDVHQPWRKVKVTNSRAAADFAACMRGLADVPFPEASVFGWCWTICRRTSPDRSTLPGFPPVRSATGAAPPGVPLCPQARQLAQHGRDRKQPMPGPAHRHPKAVGIRDRRLGTTA